VPFKNFSVWRGRLPHWRADDVTYYATFRHSRELTLDERIRLTTELVKAEGRAWELLIICVLPERTEMLFRATEREFSTAIEKAKSRVGKWILKRTDERFPPFYSESYDRIVRDEAELEERWQEILLSPVTLELVEEPEEYQPLWVRDARNAP
jgi:hypothetical protein